MARTDRPQKIKKSLIASFWDGFYASIQFGILDNFATPFLLYLGGNNLAVGILNFIRNALVSIIQGKTADISVLLHSRKKLVVVCVFLAAALILPTFLLPLLFGSSKTYVFIVLFALTSSINMFATPAWMSIMSQYIPSHKRGHYFGWRSMVLGVVYTLSILIAGLVLYYFGPISLLWAFMLLALIASIARFLSFYFLTRMYEPRMIGHTTDYFSLWAFIRKFPRSNFARYCVFAAFFLSGIFLAAPFIPVYFLQEMKFNYFEFTLLTGAAAFMTMITQEYWGRFSDRYGNIKILKLTCALMATVPIMLVFAHSFYVLILVQILAGFIWAGFNITSTNFIYDVAVPAKRERCVSYYNFLTGMGIGVGALLGGILFKYLPPIGTQYYTLFIVSAALRLFGAILINYFVKEVRSVEPVRVKTLLFELSGIRYIGLISKKYLGKKKEKTDYEFIGGV
ncbi:MAG: MFS transporter [Candidatus Margulisiibacteriota bacterium]